MVQVGGIVSVGGGGGGSGGGSTSGITSINGATGPAISIIGTSGTVVETVGNTVFINGGKVAFDFTDITAQTFVHSKATTDVIVQVQDNQVPPQVLIPDKIIIDDINSISLRFNAPQSGRVIIL